MSEALLSAGGAVWLGLLTSLSPCLLSTNVAAISFLARRAASPRLVAQNTAWYIVGQALAFVGLAALVLSSLYSMPVLSHWLQRYMFRLLGPIMLVSALFLLELVQIELRSERLRAWGWGRGDQAGKISSMLLGMVFALSFCPTTAALFFGSLLPLAVAQNSRILLPTLFAVGVALPVIVFSAIITTATAGLGKLFARASAFEKAARNVTGGLFLLIGVYFTLAYTLELW